MNPHAALRGLRFSKMQGAGNDFVLVDARNGRPELSPEAIRWIADRRTGVGFDQLLSIEPPRSDGAALYYGIWNTDGSRAGQCGNGARCVAAWARRAGLVDTDAFQMDSPSGPVDVRMHAADDIEVSLGQPDFRAAALPALGVGAPDGVVEVDGAVHPYRGVSMGNPHALIEVADVDTAPVAAVGARPAGATRAFPTASTSASRQVLRPRHIRLRVFERGVGETLACGSGACAAVAVLQCAREVDASAASRSTCRAAPADPVVGPGPSGAHARPGRIRFRRRVLPMSTNPRPRCRRRVAAYLRGHPEFLQMHPDLPPAWRCRVRPALATSLTAYQLEVLRDKNRELTRRLQELYRDRAGERAADVERTHQLTLALLRADSTSARAAAMVASLIEDFHSDLVRVVLIDPGFEAAAAEWLHRAPARERRSSAQFAEFLRSADPLCGRLAPAKMEFLFGAEAAVVQSCALIPLPGRGLMAIGSREPNRFYPGMGTLFLRMMGEALAAALSRPPG